MIVEVNVFVMPRHFDRFSGLTGLVVEYVSTLPTFFYIPFKLFEGQFLSATHHDASHGT
jgi:hypothetical protein